MSPAPTRALFRAILLDERFARCYEPVALSRDYVFDPRAGNKVGLFRGSCP